MKKWSKRLGGFGVSALLFLHGLPGFINDSVTWLSWIKTISFLWIVYPVGIGGGLLLGTSEWWWPYVSRRINRMKLHRETQEPDADANALPTPTAPTADPAQIDKFRELEPLITRHRDARKPIRDPFLTSLLWNASAQFASRADHEELVAYLDALKIPHPPSDAGREIWFHYLVRLEATCQAGDLQEARSLYNEDGAG